MYQLNFSRYLTVKLTGNIVTCNLTYIVISLAGFKYLAVGTHCLLEILLGCLMI
jgi:hypothetical protein